MFAKSYSDRYSAKAMAKPVNFIFIPNETVENVFLVGDFNNWCPQSNPLERQRDGSWAALVPMNHGHHRYAYLVDGERVLDPKAMGVARDDYNERVSLIAVS